MEILWALRRAVRFLVFIFLMLIPALVGGAVVLVRVEDNVRLVVGQELLEFEREGLAVGWLKKAFGLHLEPTEGELFRQIDEEHLEGVTMLLGAGISADARDSESRTAIHRAVQRKSVSILRELIASKANIDLQDGSGQTPLIQAIRSNHGETVAQLLQFGADPNLASGSGDLPLQYAVREQHLPLIELLLDSKANVNRANKAGLTPLMMALLTQNEKVITLLIERGANIHAKDGAGKTVRQYGDETKNQNIIALFGGEGTSQREQGYKSEYSNTRVVEEDNASPTPEVAPINITRLRGVGEPRAVWSARSGRITLDSIKAPVRNIGAVTAKGIKVTVKAPNGAIISLQGPAELEPNKRGLYTASTNELVPFVRKLEAVATCSNCEE